MVKFTKEEKKSLINKLSNELKEEEEKFKAMSKLLKIAMGMRKEFAELAKNKNLDKDEKKAMVNLEENKKRIATYGKFVGWVKENLK